MIYGHLAGLAGRARGWAVRGVSDAGAPGHAGSRTAGPRGRGRGGAVVAARYALAVSWAIAGLLAPATSARVAHAALVTTTYSSGPLSRTIPDLGAIEDGIRVGDDGEITDLKVRVRLDHSYVSDLTVSLRGPDGTQIDLSSENGGDGDNYGAGPANCSGSFTTFDSRAGPSIVEGTPPFLGAYRPEGALFLFPGRQAAGLWTLVTADDYEQDVGTLFCWELEITRNPSGADLSVTVSDAPDPIRAGGTLTYTLTAANAGPSDTTATVTHSLPSEATFVSATPTRGMCSRTGTTVTCTLGKLAAGSTATVTVAVAVPPLASGAASLSSSATIQGAESDPAPSNNSTSVQTTTVYSCTPPPSITQSAVPDGSGRVRVSVATTMTSGAPGNRVRAIRFDAGRNARVEVGGQVRQAPFTLPLEHRPTEASFVVRRGDAPGAFTQPFIVIDDCGERPSFAGGGPNV